LLHQHTFFEPCIVLSGTGVFHYRNRKFKLQAGDLFISDPGTPHIIESNRTKDLQLLYTSFAVIEVEKEFSIYSDNEIIWNFMKSHQVHQAGQSHLIPFFTNLHSLSQIEGLRNKQELLKEWMRQWILQVMLNLTDSHGARSKTTEPHPSPVQRALDTMDQEIINGSARVSTIARKSGISQRNLQRMFRKHLKRSVSREIQERKIQRAATLLSQLDLTIANVSESLGIHDPGQLSRLFKKITGLSPRKFRSNHKFAVKHNWIQIGEAPLRTEFIDSGKRKHFASL
jgi:AraC-like DNA-binding protein